MSTKKDNYSEEIDDIVRLKNQGMTKGQIIRFEEITGQTKLRQYLKKNKKARKKLISKIAKGVKYHKYEQDGTPIGRDIEGYELPEKKKKEPVKKEKKKSEKKTTKKKTTKKKQKISDIDRYKLIVAKLESNKKLTRADKDHFDWMTKRAPSGRQYSKSNEIHEGFESKRAIEYRRKNNIPQNDYTKE